jgi:GNAT superfamily N-acetyltransferase
MAKRSTMAKPADEVVTAPLTEQGWDDLVALFGTRGDPSWCWCQFFLTTGKDYTGSSAANKAALREQVTTDPRPQGVIAHLGDEAVGWVQVGPRAAYPRLVANRAMRAVTGDDLDDPSVWAVTCFVVKVGRRRKGVATALLAAAIELARAHGARILEGHPVDVAARSGRVSGAELYHGVATTFERAGFVEVGRTGATRPVMRISL